MSGHKLPLEIRFWERVNKDTSTGCWVWKGRLRWGYGTICAGGRGGRILMAHRLSYEMHKGPIPEGLIVDHMCHNRACVNPDHLHAVTRQQNQENRAGATRTSRTGVRGVSWSKGMRAYEARVVRFGKAHIAGYFTTIAEAERAAIALRNEIHTNNLADRRPA